MRPFGFFGEVEDRGLGPGGGGRGGRERNDSTKKKKIKFVFFNEMVGLQMFFESIKFFFSKITCFGCCLT
jgi:hypothetical protein